MHKRSSLCGLVIVSAALSLPFDGAAAGDRYANFADLSANAREGVDFEVINRDVGASISVLAIHGGNIEPGTDAIARAIAGGQLNLYIFRAMKPSGSWDMHVTSTHFDDPRAVKMVSGSVYAVSIHGEGASGEDEVCLGGANATLRDRLAERLQGLFRVQNPCQAFPGVSPENIVNRAVKQGVQLELSKSLRQRLQSDQGLLRQFASMVREVMLSH